MAVSKLSQIAGAPAPPALTDRIVGVGSGTTDYQYTFAQALTLFDVFLKTGSNVVFYVASTGSDSNPGTVGSPFATLGRALLAVGNTDYQNTYNWTINVADGTYTENGNNWITPVTAFNLPLGGGHILGNTSIPSNVVFTSLTNGFTHNGAYELLIEGFQFENAGFVPSLFIAGGGGGGVATNGNGCGILYGSFNIVTNNPNFGYIFQAGAGALIDDVGSTTINVSGTHQMFGTVFSGDGGCQFNMDGGVAAFNASGAWATGTNWMNLTSGASLVFEPGSVTGISSSSLGSAFNFCAIITANGAVTDFPGVTSIGTQFIDSTTYWTNFVVGSYVAAALSLISGPAPLPSWVGLFDDTNKVPYMAANDGTNTFLNSLSTKYKVSTPSSGGTVTSSVGLKSNILTPAGTLATLTVNLPAGIKDGYTTRISTSQTITALTVATTDSSAVVGAPSTLPANSGVQFVFDAGVGAHGTWYIN